MAKTKLTKLRNLLIQIAAMCIGYSVGAIFLIISLPFIIPILLYTIITIFIHNLRYHSGENKKLTMCDCSITWTGGIKPWRK